MSAPPPLGAGPHLTHNAPASPARIADLLRRCTDPAPSSVLDLGCGWATFLLDVLTHLPTARGTGVDRDATALERAAAEARRRGLEDRVELTVGDAAATSASADLVLSIGAYAAFGPLPAAVPALADRVRPGGRLLLGAEFWEVVPDESRLARMWEGMTAADCLTLPALVDTATDAGLRPLHLGTVSPQEWEDYESDSVLDQELWLVEHPTHPDAARVRAAVDLRRSRWLDGHRGHLGFAYLLLGRPVPAGAG